MFTWNDQTLSVHNHEHVIDVLESGRFLHGFELMYGDAAASGFTPMSQIVLYPTNMCWVEIMNLHFNEQQWASCVPVCATPCPSAVRQIIFPLVLESIWSENLMRVCGARGERAMCTWSAGGRGRSRVVPLPLITADGSLVFYLHVKGNAHIVYAFDWCHYFSPEREVYSEHHQWNGNNHFSPRVSNARRD